MDDPDNPSPPPLPPRKPTETAPEDASSTGPTPPPLPARKPPPPPIKPPSQIAREQAKSAPSHLLDRGPSTAPAVSVTPATPPSRKPSGALGGGANGTSAPPGPAAAPESHRASSQLVQSFWTDLREQLPYPDVLVVGMLLLDLYWAKLSFHWVLMLGAAYAVLRRHHIIRVRASMVRARSGGETPPEDGKASPVAWLNHTLYALFPLISTDVLTPFIDLMEDALIQQCPAIVTSVRLTSASLGAQPVLLTSLKALSDDEWFRSLAPPTEDKGKTPNGKAETKGHTRVRSESSAAPPNLRPAPKLDRTPSSSSIFGRSRSSSSATLSSGAEANIEGERRRKRDRILQRLSRSRRREASGRTLDTDEPSQAARPDGNRDALHPSDAEGDSPLPAEEDIDAERYVNYQVGFTYDRPESLNRKGWGLHALAYIGWGVKGIGKSEIPVYIDVLSIKGTVNLRLLLSATPPFVRTATFSFPHLPVVDLSAVPLRKHGFDAMGLPGMKSYVQASIAEVASAFVRPNSYSLDVERLLVGRDSSLRTHSIGALQIVIHSAEGLRRTDTVGSCDPYVVVSYSKFNKPLFSTRTIVGTLAPTWEETTFLLVFRDAVESGEKLRLRVVDADRFSSDDAIGVVEEDLADLVDESQTGSADALPIRRTSELEADHPGMRVSGTLDWSIRFYPLWEISQNELDRRLQEQKAKRKGEPDPNTPQKQPWFLELFNSFMQGQDWERDRAARRRETLAWFTGEKEREEMEAAMRPSEEMRSGVLQFHIHQCDDLEIEVLQGTFSSPNRKSHDLSAAGGKPALSEVIDRTSAENTEPPSAYCEVHLNDALVYRTRTKQITPSPYFNAVSERFVRDWRMAKVVFVVRDERNLEHDAILGIVSLSLADVFKTSSQFTRWFPLVGGLGWGRIRLSLLFKPIEIKLPPFISGYQVATLSIKSLSATQIRASPTSLSVVIETETDSFELCDPEEVDNDDDGADTPDGTPSKSDRRLSRSASFKSLGSAARNSFDFSQAVDVEWEITKPIRLAVQYRHSCNVVLRFFSKSNVRRKKRVKGIACFRLDDVPDGREYGKCVPIFETDEVRTAVKASYDFELDNDEDTELPRADTSDVVDTPGTSKSVGTPGPGDVQVLGFVSLKFKVYPGVSKAHEKLCKKDLRFKRVYEGWEIAREVEKGWDKVNSRDITRIAKDEAKIKAGKPHGSADGVGVSRNRLDDEAGDSDNDDDDNELDEDEDENVGTVNGTGSAQRTPNKKTSKGSLDDHESGILSEAKAHAKALHKRNKGVFQLKIARTGKYMVDKLQAKAYARKDLRRQRGTDLDVEYEGQSHL